MHNNAAQTISNLKEAITKPDNWTYTDGCNKYFEFKNSINNLANMF